MFDITLTVAFLVYGLRAGNVDLTKENRNKSNGRCCGFKRQG